MHRDVQLGCHDAGRVPQSSPWQTLSLPQLKQGLRSSSWPVSCFNSLLSRVCRSCPSRWYTHLPAAEGGKGGKHRAR